MRVVLDRVYAAAAFVVPLIVYCRTASGEPGSWDTAELQSVPYVLGIAHPTGFPLYTMLGWLFGHLFVFGTPAFRLNVFAGVCTSAACLSAYLTAREIEVPKEVALAAALWFSILNVIWVHAARAEVHDLALALSAFTILQCVRLIRTGEPRALLLVALFWGLALATHPIAIWLAPGIALAVALASRKPQARVYADAVLVLLACVALYAYLPVRSAYVVSHRQDPTSGMQGVNGSIVVNYNDPRTPSGFIDEISGSQFGAREALWSAWNPASLSSYAASWVSMLRETFGWLGLILAAAGLAALVRRDWRVCLALVVCCVAAVPFSYAYAPVEGDPDRYRVLSLWLMPVLMGAAALKFSQWDGVRRLAVFAALAFSCGQMFLAEQQATFANRNDAGGRNTISQAASRIPPGTIVVTAWIDATSLAYGEFVDGTFAGRTVIPAWPPELAADYAVWKSRPIYIIGPPGLSVPGFALQNIDSWDSTHVLYRLGRMRKR